MPAKRKTKSKAVAAIVEKPVKVVTACGHINRHYTGKEELACVLLKGHPGDHEADYPNGRAYWGDAAGKPPAPIGITPAEDESRREATIRKELGAVKP